VKFGRDHILQLGLHHFYGSFGTNGAGDSVLLLSAGGFQEER